MNRLSLFGVLLLFFSISLFSQDTTKVYISQTFRSTSLINMQTTETVGKNAFDLNIQHRFGLADVNHNLLNDFFGMDLSSNIRIQSSIALNDRIHLGIGRTKYMKNLDVEVKYRLFRQTENNTIPLNITLYHNTSYMTDKFPELAENAFEADGITPFSYSEKHRYTYLYQLIFSRYFNRTFSFLISPVFIHYNLVEPGDYNQAWIFPMGGRIKTSLLSYVIVEYNHIYKNNKHHNNLSFAYEIGTASHVFQLLVCSTNKILAQKTIETSGENIFDGKFYLGFNIYRRFYYKND